MASKRLFMWLHSSKVEIWLPMQSIWEMLKATKCAGRVCWCILDSHDVGHHHEEGVSPGGESVYWPCGSDTWTSRRSCSSVSSASGKEHAKLSWVPSKPVLQQQTILAIKGNIIYRWPLHWSLYASYLVVQKTMVNNLARHPQILLVIPYSS